MEKKLFDNYSEKLKALGHPIRLSIATLLIDQDYTVNEICEKLSVAQATISQHLSVLRSKGIINGSRHGTSISYGLSSNIMKEMLIKLRSSINERIGISQENRLPQSATVKNIV